MGSTQASGMADAAKNGVIGLKGAMVWHLRSNHYPPLPYELVAVAVRAVTKAREGLWESRVRLPAGVVFRGRKTATVADVIESLHLDEFVEGGE